MLFRSIAVQHRERLDCSGYPRGLTGGAISRLARVLGAADAYQSMREPRPHRPALSADEAAAELRTEVRAGRLETAAVSAVLEAAGGSVKTLDGRPFIYGKTDEAFANPFFVARGAS